MLDRCLEENVHFDCCIGVSAGSANMTSYVAGQKGRNKPFYDEYSFRKEYMSVKNLLEKMYEKGRSDAEKLLRWRA